MKKILFILFIIFVPLGTGAKSDVSQSGCLEANIFFVLDWSGSVSDIKNWSIKPLNYLLENLELSEHGVKLSTILFGSGYSVLSDLSWDSNDLSQKFLDLENTETTGLSNLSSVFDPINSLIESDKKNRGKEVVNIIIIISDGDIDDPDGSIVAMEKLKQSHHIFSTSLLLENEYSRVTNLIKLASENAYFGKDYKALIIEIKKLDTCL